MVNFKEKKVVALFTLLLVAFLIPSVKVSAAENLAYKKTVTATTTESGSYPAANAVDADGNTRWSSSYADNQNFIVDLGGNYTVSSVKIAWEAAYASQYQIQVSTDGHTWTTVYENYNATGGTQTISFSATTARYVKAYCIKRATSYGFSFYEFEVYGDATNATAGTGTAGNQLSGKKLVFLGSSVTYGYASGGVSFVDYLQQRNGCTVVKEAVSGTTLAVSNVANSYVERMEKNLASQKNVDHFICQLSTNDASNSQIALGTVSTSKDLSVLQNNKGTIIGAMEYIIAYAKDKWNCPVTFYTGTYYSNTKYQQMVDALYSLQEKWGIGIVDLYNNQAMRNVSSADRARYMADDVHPTAAGYLEWWTPVFEEYFRNYYSNSSSGTNTTSNSSSGTNGGSANATTSGTENIAYKKNVTVSSTESSSYAGANAVDADGNTRWSSSYADNQNFVVDLGSNYSVSSFKIAWEAAYASQYQIQVSTDNSTWTTVYENYSATGGTQTINISATNARYVKVYCIKRATAYGFSIYEFEVYGNASGNTSNNNAGNTATNASTNTATATTNASTNTATAASNENIAYKKNVTVSSTESSSYAGANAVDADGNTRWSSSYADDQNFIVDLGSAYSVSSFKVAWEL